jgi:hypothetical protein
MDWSTLNVHIPPRSRSLNVMAIPDNDTSVGHSFGLEIDGVVIKSIREVAGLKMESEVSGAESRKSARFLKELLV